MIVKVYGMRHGEKEAGPNSDLAGLTEKGKEQIRKSAANNLAAVNFMGFYSSMKFRAIQSVVEAISVLPQKNNNLGINASIGFDYSGAPELEKLGEFQKEVKRQAQEEQRPITVGLWRKVAPKTIGFLGDRVLGEICRIAMGMYGTGANECNVLVASHSPTIELASVDPDIPILQEADLVLYTLEVEPRKEVEDIVVKIVSTTYIPRGF